MNMLGKKSVLMLNYSWVAIGVTTPEEAFVDMSKGTKLGMVITKDNESLYPVSWDEWLKLPVEEPEFTVHTSKLAIRIPKVIIAVNYNKVLMKEPQMTKENIYKRDGHRCAYTGKRLSNSEKSLDHVLPKSRGGKDNWLNLVTCDKSINFAKGDKTPEEAGLTLRFKPTQPKVVPVSMTISNPHGIKEWELFLNN